MHETQGKERGPPTKKLKEIVGKIGTLNRMLILRSVFFV